MPFVSKGEVPATLSNDPTVQAFSLKLPALFSLRRRIQLLQADERCALTEPKLNPSCLGSDLWVDEWPVR